MNEEITIVDRTGRVVVIVERKDVRLVEQAPEKIVEGFTS